MTLRSRRGTAAIEFGLAFPLVMMVLAGIIDGSMYLLERHSAVRAARDGARIGASTLEDIPVSGDLIEGRAKQFAEASLAAAGATGNVVTDWFTDTDGWCWIRVTISLEHRSLFGGFSPFGKDMVHSFVMLTQEQIY